MKIGLFEVFIIFVMCYFLISLVVGADTRTQDEVVRDKIAIIETAKDNPTPEVVAMAETAKAELKELQDKKFAQIEKAKAQEQQREHFLPSSTRAIIIFFTFLISSAILFKLLSLIRFFD